MDSPSKIDVFFRTTGYKPDFLGYVRKAMRKVCFNRWQLEPVRIHTILNEGIRAGRQFSEDSALSDPYIFTDDDCLIVGKDWVKRAVEIMLANPQFKIVSTLSLVETENAARPPSEWHYINGPEHVPSPTAIYPMHMVGQPMLIRKGTCVNLPEMSFDQECAVLHKLVLDQGFEEGLFHPDLRIRHNHLGHGFSGSPVHFWGF